MIETHPEHMSDSDWEEFEFEMAREIYCRLVVRDQEVLGAAKAATSYDKSNPPLVQELAGCCAAQAYELAWQFRRFTKESVTG